MAKRRDGKRGEAYQSTLSACKAAAQLGCDEKRIRNCLKRLCINRFGSTVKRPAEERFWEKVDKRGACWIWTGYRMSSGYGWFNPGGGKSVLAHRYSYLLLRGEIPVGLHLDHLCRTPPCVNPAHLEPVSPAENVRRGIRATSPHCRYGHAYTAVNTLRRARGGRECRICCRISDHQRPSGWVRQRKARAMEEAAP